MNLKKVAVSVFFALSTQFAFAQNANQLNGFDFNYSVDLNKSIGLTQVFDDGDRTYFQFTQADILPTIHAIKNGKKVSIPLEARPPYLIASGVAKKYVLSGNNGKTSIYVSYNGSRVEPQESKMVEKPQAKESEYVTKAAPTSTAVKDEKSAPEVVKQAQARKTINESVEDTDQNSSSADFATGTLLNIPFFENSINLSKKAKGDLVTRLKEIARAPRIVIRGRPSVNEDTTIANTRALAIKQFLVENDIDANSIEVTTDKLAKEGRNKGFYLSELILLSSVAKRQAFNTQNPPPIPKKPTWELTLADNNLETALNKWAAKAGYQQVVWDMPAEIPINSTVKFEGTFEEAVEAVVNNLRQSELPIKAKFYANKVIRITSLTGAK